MIVLTAERLDLIVSSAMSEIGSHVVPLLVFKSGTQKCVNFGTGMLVETNRGTVLVTAKHVLQEALNLGNLGRLQIGADRFVLRELYRRSICLGKRADIGSIFLSDDEVRQLGVSVWPWFRIASKEVCDFELVAFMGFPGYNKQFISEVEIHSLRYQCVATVETVEYDQFSLKLDENRYEIEPIGESWATENDVDEAFDLGGISGAPVFSLITGLPHLTVRKRPKLVGWVYEGKAWSKLEQKVYVAKASFLAPDGSIQ